MPLIPGGYCFDRSASIHAYLLSSSGFPFDNWHGFVTCARWLSFCSVEVSTLVIISLLIIPATSMSLCQPLCNNPVIYPARSILL